MTIKFEIKFIKPNLCDYSDAYIFVPGNITAEGGDANTKAAFKNFAPFTRCVTHIHDAHVETAENLDMYNLFEYMTIMQTILEVFISLKETNKI